MSSKKHYDIIIGGSGISGLSAAVYTERGGDDTLVIKGDEPGGQLTLTTEVANYPGFPESVGGMELVNRIEDQARNFGTDFTEGIIESIDKKDRFIIKLSNGDVYTSDAFICASGASARNLNIEGEDELMGYGVSTCATCDGAFFKNEDMAVVGGGDAAFEEAVFLTEFANKVYLIHRREGIRAEEHLQDKVEDKIDNGEIELILNTEVTKVVGSQDNGIKNIKIVSNPSGYPSDKMDSNDTTQGQIDVEALFIAIGHEPNTDYLSETKLNLDEKGYVEYNRESDFDTGTNVPGLFAAGDVADDHYQQAATAAGSGVKSAMDADDYLEKIKD